MWNWRKRHQRARKNQHNIGLASIENLEGRALLAGNVVASLRGGHLTLTGDNSVNAIEVAVEDNNGVVRGLNETTVNGGTTAFIAASGSDTISGSTRIFLKNGNDSVVFSRGVKLGGAVTVEGGAGNDTMSSTNATFLRSVSLNGGAGNNTFSLQSSSIQSSMVMTGSSGEDLVTLKDLTNTGSITVHSGAGDDGVSLNDVSGTGSYYLETGAGDDDVAIRNSTIGGTVFIRTRYGNDVVAIEDNVFDNRLTIRTGANTDAIDIRETNTFNGAFVVNTGKSRRAAGDALSIDASNTFNSTRSTTGNRTTTIPSSSSDRIDDDTSGLVARASTADTAVQTLAVSLTATASSSKSINSAGGVVVTRDSNVTITGKTISGATVTIDSNNDGTADQTITAGADGSYTANVTVTRRDLYTTDATPNDQLGGLQTIKVRSTVANAGSNEVSVLVDYVTGTLVQFDVTKADGGTESYEVELFDTLAPKAATNFLAYVNSSRYTNTIVHRSVSSPAVIQGGGFTLNNGLFGDVQTDAGINVDDEFNAARGNIAGTLSLANAGATNNSTKSQWFINTSNNSTSLDSQKFAVFGRVVGNGMTIVNSIRALTTDNFTDESNSAALTDVPVRSTVAQFGRPVTGKVTATTGSTTLVGVGTKFTTELKAGGANDIRSRIQINGRVFEVTAIQDDTHLTLSEAPSSTFTNVTARTDINDDKQFVKFTSVDRILT
ncbi:MAG: peptidylprolyl isomerase [Planctomycetota bacterium]